MHEVCTFLRDAIIILFPLYVLVNKSSHWVSCNIIYLSNKDN